MSNGGGWRIRYECPQCGAPVALGEAVRVLSCPYCRSRLYLDLPDRPRYFLPPPGDGDDLFFVPYRRRRGLVFTMAPGGVTARYLDTNHIHVDLPHLPLSLGVRPQAMTLNILGPAAAGLFLRPGPQEPYDVGAPGSEVFIGEGESLIYSPFYVRDRRIWDAFLRRPVAPLGDTPVERLGALAPEERRDVRFVAAICPRCGGDLAGEGEAAVLTCGNCDSAWTCRKGALGLVPHALKGGPPEALYLPFWRLRVALEGLEMDSVGDLIRLANLPRVVGPQEAGRPLYFWVPAFKINPALFLRWCRQLTVYQPGEDLTVTLSGARLFPATLPEEEALAAVPLILAQIVTDKRLFFRALPGLKVRPAGSLLFYQPFVTRNRELLHAELGLTMDMNALRFGTKL